MLGYNFKKLLYFLPEDIFTFTNSVDPDEMQHYAAFHLGLHCLPKYPFWGFPNTKIQLLHIRGWVGGGGVSEILTLKCSR